MTMTTRDDVRRRLRELSDAQLVERCVLDVLAQRRARSDRGLRDLRDLAEAEVARRGVPGMLDAVHAEVRRREAEARAGNRRAAEGLNKGE